MRVGEYHVLNTNEPDDHVDRRIKKVVTHRSFDKITYEYDIALLEMHDGPIKYQVALNPFRLHITFLQPNIIPICLPDNDNRLVGQVGTVTGWGRLSEFGQISPVLREVKLPIISNSKCMSMYRFANDKLSGSDMSKLPGILVRTSGFPISLSALEQAQEVKTAVRGTVVALWSSR